MRQIRFIKAVVPIFLFGLIVALIVFPSCVSKKKFEEANQQVQSLQAKISDLEKDVAEKEAEINRLKKEISNLQSQIPVAYEVQRGDSHWKIAFDFLTKKGLSEEAVRKILYESILFDPIQIGFRVFNYFSGDVFGSFLNQGSASISPSGLMRFLKKQAEEEKLNLKNEIGALTKKLEELNVELAAVKKEKETAVSELNTRIDSLNKEIKNFQARTGDMDSRLNSVYYFAETKESLKAKGKIKGTFLGICGTRVGEVTFADFNKRIDLRQNDTIEIQAADLGITAIKEVELLPGDLKKNLDYRVVVAGNGASAKITLNNKDKFLLARLIVLVN